MARVTLDSGAVLALARRESTVRAYIERALNQRDLLVIPAVVIAETTRGDARDAPVNQVIKAVNEVALCPRRRRDKAGRLLGRIARRGPTVDALVAAEAAARGPAVVLTGDPKDFAELLDGHPQVRVHRV